MNNQTIGKRIALLRQEHALTQQQLASMLNVTHQAVSRWESGQSLPDMGTLLELTRVFGTTVEQLTGEEAPQQAEVPETEQNEQGEAPQEAQAPEENSEENPEAGKKEAERMNAAQLIRMAPFMSKEAVGEIAMKIEEKMTANQIARLAPFLQQECLKELLEKHQPELTWDTLRRLAPFLGKEYVDRIAKEISDGTRPIVQPNDDINRTLDDIGKAFSDISKDVGKAFDDFGRGFEKTVRKAIRFGGRVVNEVSNAVEDMAKGEDGEFGKVRSARAAEIRKKAFERALESGNWDWLGKHIGEIRGDEELMGRIAAKAREAGQQDWICKHMGGYADEATIDAAIREGNWAWLGDNCYQFSPEIQQKVALEAMRAENWQWLGIYAEQLELGPCAYEIAEKAMHAGATVLAANIAAAHLDQSQKNDLLKSACAAGKTELIDEMIGLADGEFRKWLIVDLARSGAWDRVEKYAPETDPETLEEVYEIAVEQGNFDAIDMMDKFM